MTSIPDRSSRYRLTPLAESDLEEIWLYTLRTWSREQADSYFRTLLATFEGLAVGTKTGRPVEIREGYLKYNVGSHIVFYRRAGQTTDIIRILHQRMDIGRHL
ncbi:type II toxin-antitoxin system RelE/ParE family toxin [Labrys neptuniae]|uniref:Toxin n=1 Tax=Labrys neptuniae TaxID=376174 RepID=A0ABV3PQH4_9HYPH